MDVRYDLMEPYFAIANFNVNQCSPYKKADEGYYFRLIFYIDEQRECSKNIHTYKESAM